MHEKVEYLRALFVSHSYAAPENRKNLIALSRYGEVLAIVPTRLRNPWVPITEAMLRADSSLLVRRQPFFVGKEILLRGIGSILKKFVPHVVVVEYNPWQPISLQVLLTMRRIAPHVRLVIAVKKNTYLGGHIVKELAKQAAMSIVRKYVSGWIACSRMTANLLEDRFGIDAEDIYVCHHLGVDLDLFRPAISPQSNSDSEVTVGYVGALEGRKGVPELVDAIQWLVRYKGLPVRLRLLGDGTLGPELRERAAGTCWLSVEGPVEHAKVAPFLRECTIFAFPSRILPDHQEHDAHALMEAMASGLPIISTRSGIIPELVDASCAVLVPERDSAALASAVERLIGDPIGRLTMGSAARRIAEHEFGLETVARRRMTILDYVVTKEKAAL